MMKEINEQPRAVQDTLNYALENGRIDLGKIGITDEIIKEITQIHLPSPPLRRKHPPEHCMRALAKRCRLCNNKKYRY